MKVVSNRYLSLSHCLAACVFAGATSAWPAQFKFPNQTFTVPDGFTVELVAGPPLVDRPIMGDFDEQGRFYVADSSGSNEPVAKQVISRPHRILRLEDTDGDGRFDHRVVFADKLMFPEGVLWFDGAVYYAGAPSLWKLEDTGGDGVADRRTEWFQGLTLTGCANDTHGPYLGPDGWLYWCKGGFAKQTHERPGRPPISDSAAHIFRCRPDGSEFDSVMSGGMDNPVEVAFSPEGETFFTTTFFSHPEAGKRDAVVHAIYGGVYPKVHGVLDGLPRTGDLLPPLTQLGPAAACALLRYSSTAFGPEYQGNLFSSLFNLRKVVRHVLRPSGSTFASTDTDFLVSDNPDFHPTDLIEDADGSLLVIDTGGWYKICCPTSQLAKPDILGAIYRVRRQGARSPDDPRGLKLAWPSLSAADLAGLMGDSRPAVTKRALAQIAKQGAKAVSALAAVLHNSTSQAARQNALWALTRIDGPEARVAVRSALADPTVPVRQTATYSAGLRRDRAAVPALLEELASASLHLQRNAATALGQIADPIAVPSLLAAAGIPHDRPLEHALIYALIQIDDREQTTKGLTAASSFTRRAALIALDQMPGGDLAAAAVAPYLSSTDPTLKSTALWIVAHRPQWGGELSGLYEQWLKESDLSKDRATELESQLAQFTQTPAIQAMLAATLTAPAVTPAAHLAILDAMAKSSLKVLPTVWIAGLGASLGSPSAEVVGAALTVLRNLPLGRSTNSAALSAPLLVLARDTARPTEVRLEALTALVHGLRQPEPELFEFLCRSLDPAAPPLTRTLAARALAQARLGTDQLSHLADLVAKVGPMELSRLLGAFDQSSDPSVGLKLVQSLTHSASLASLRADMVRPHLEQYPAAVHEAAKGLLASLNQDAAQQQAHLDALLAHLANGDRDRGRRIFERNTTACSTCHQVGYVGGHVGPDLTKIGAIRTERDLLEAVVYPSASFVRSFEPVIVTAKDGEEYSGILHQESADSLVIVSGPGAEHRLALSDVAEMRPGSVSVMPEGLVQPLSSQELADLIAFLQSLK